MCRIKYFGRNAVLFRGILLGLVITWQVEKMTVSVWESLNAPEEVENVTLPPLFEGLEYETRFGSNFTYLYQDNGTIGAALAKKVRILCWILTNATQHESRARHVRNTWAQHCNTFVFLSTEDDPTLPSVNINTTGHKRFWQKTNARLRYLYDNYNTDDYDWWLKADDETYVVMENLRLMLLPHSPNDLIFFGSKFKNQVPVKYMNGSGGYVLSRAAFAKLVLNLLKLDNCLVDDTFNEDVKIGKCLTNIDVKLADTRDSLGRHRFFSAFVDHHLVPVQMAEKNFTDGFWLQEYSFYPLEQGPECCSDYAVSFYGTEPNMMYVLEYFIYHLQVYGIRTKVTENYLEEAYKVAKKLLPPSNEKPRVM